MFPKHVQWMSLAETQLSPARVASEPRGQLRTLLSLVIPPCDTAHRLWMSPDHQDCQVGTRPAQQFWGAASSPLSCVSAHCLHGTEGINTCMSCSCPLRGRPELHITEFLLVPISQFTGRQRYGPGIHKFPGIIVPQLCQGTAGPHAGDTLVCTFPGATKLPRGV